MQETQINMDSEIGALNAVMVHRPGREIENMTPASAAEVLYDDILNLQLAEREHDQLTGVLRRVADLYEAHTPEFFALATREAGKSLFDGVAEVREAAD